MENQSFWSEQCIPFIVNLIAVSVGVRWFQLPYVAFESGLTTVIVSWIGAILLIVLSSMILVSVTYRGKDKYRVSKYLPPYEVIVEQTYGFFASLVQCLFFFNFACRNYLAMMMEFSDMISNLFALHEVPVLSSQSLWIFIYAIITFILTLLSEVKHMSILSLAGILLEGFVFFVIIIFGFLNLPHENVNLLVYDNSHETVNWDTLLNLYLGYSFSYYIPNIMFNCDRKNEWRGYLSVFLAIVLSMTLTTCLAIIAALLYFNSDRICSLQRMNKLCRSWEYYLVLVCVCVSYICLSPITLYPAILVLEYFFHAYVHQYYHFKKTVIVSSYSQILIRLGTILFVIVYQLFLSNETTFLGDQWLVSSYLVCMLPSVLHMGLFKGKRWYFYIIDYLLISVGILLLIRGVVAMV